MAEREVVTTSLPSAPGEYEREAVPPGTEALFAVPYPAPDRTRPRIISYWLILILLSGGAILIRSLPWQGDPFLHSLFEAVAAVFALLVGGLALMRYYARPERIFLYLGTGYVGAAALTAFHALLTGPMAPSHVGATFTSSDAWTWWAGQLYLSVFYLAAFSSGRSDDRASVRHDVSTYLTGVGVALLLASLDLWLPRPSVVFLELGVHRPYELLPAFTFALALIGFLRRESWRRDRFHHWVVVALWLNLTLHVGFMAFAGLPFDPLHDAAHLLKIAAHVALLHGLLLSLYARLRLGGKAFATELILEESRRQLQDFLDNALDLFQSTAPDGRILYVNRAWKERLGYTDGDLENLDLFAIVHPNSQTSFKRNFQRVLRGEALRNVEVQFVGADGQVVLCSGNMNCRFEEGRPVATRSIFRDVTQQRLAERELEASRANLTALVENTGDSIWSVDSNLRLITFNSAFALAVEARTSREPQVGAPLEAIFRFEDVEHYRELFHRALAGARFSQVRVEEIEGQTRHFELFFNPILGERGIRGVVVFGKDVTPRRRAEEALQMAKEEAEAANKAKSQFLASMSHELRTPLNSVIGFANVLRRNRQQTLNDQEIGFLDRILSNGKHLLTLINEVLDLAKVEAGRMEIELTPVDLATLAGETLAALEGQLKGRKVELRADVPAGLLPLSTDPHRLKQVVINLVGNALKFTETGEVVVRVEADPETGRPLSLAVVDSGIGIPEERLKAIFEAFQQAEAGTARRYGGTGLGLTISRSICALLGYELDVESEVGVGSSFTIRFGEARTADGPPSMAEPPSMASVGGEGPGVAPTPPAIPAGPRDEATADPSESAPARADGTVASGRAPKASSAKAPPGVRGGPAPVGPGPAARSDGLRSGGGSSPSHSRSPAPGPTGTGARLSRRRRRGGHLALVIDDDEQSRLLLRRYLEQQGCRVLTAKDGAAGLEIARRERPDVITLDLLMPRMNGWEFLRVAKSDLGIQDIPVIVVSVAMNEDRGDAVGPIDFLSKPIDREDFLRVLWRTMPRSGRRLLLVDPDPETCAVVEGLLGSTELEVLTVADGRAALDALEEFGPDLVLLDLVAPNATRMELFDTVRSHPRGARLPVVVLSGRDLTTLEVGELAEGAAAVLAKSERLPTRLKELLQELLDEAPVAL